MRSPRRSGGLRWMTRPHMWAHVADGAGGGEGAEHRLSARVHGPPLRRQTGSVTVRPLGRANRGGSAAVDLLADDGDRALINRGRVPGLDGAEVRLPGLVPAAGAPAMALEEVRRRHQRRAGVVETAAGAVVQDALRQELRVADLAVHRAARARRQDAAIDQRQRRVELVGEIGAAPAVIGEGRNRREDVLVAALGAEGGLHAPDREQRPRRHAVALLDLREQRGVRLLERAPARNDRRAAALGQELVERQPEAALAAVGGDRRRGIVGAHERRDGRGADPASRLLGELPLPALEPGRRVAALRGARLAGRARERRQGRGDRLETPDLGHSELLADRTRRRRDRLLAPSRRHAVGAKDNPARKRAHLRQLFTVNGAVRVVLPGRAGRSGPLQRLRSRHRFTYTMHCMIAIRAPMKLTTAAAAATLLFGAAASSGAIAETLFESQRLTATGEYPEGIEGPAVDAAGNLYVVNLGQKGTIGRVRPGASTSELFAKLPDGSIGNGIRFDREARMYVANFKAHTIFVIEPGQAMPRPYFPPQPRSGLFDQPNDLAIAADGTLYASDPKRRTGRIWRIRRTPDGTARAVVMTSSRAMGRTNGLDLSPDGRTLYVGESSSFELWAYGIEGDKLVAPRRLVKFDTDLDGLRSEEHTS